VNTEFVNWEKRNSAKICLIQELLPIQMLYHPLIKVRINAWPQERVEILRRVKLCNARDHLPLSPDRQLATQQQIQKKVLKLLNCSMVGNYKDIQKLI
jgi:hypothetical protein